MLRYTHVVWGGGGPFCTKTSGPGIYRGRLVNQENYVENVPMEFSFSFIFFVIKGIDDISSNFVDKGAWT